MYSDIVNSIVKAANDCLPKTTFNKHAKPYWSPEVKRAHDAQRHARRIWIMEGRPRGMQSESYFAYKRSKRNFAKIQKRAIEKSRK